MSSSTLPPSSEPIAAIPISSAIRPDAAGTFKRKRTSSSGPAAKRACDVLGIAATLKAEAEKKRLKLIDTSNQAQPNIQQFFIPSAKLRSQAPNRQEKGETFSAVPVTPEVEIPPKASSTAKPDPKDVINLDDLPKTQPPIPAKAIPARARLQRHLRPSSPVTSTEAPSEEIAKRPSIDALSAKVEVLEAENESLKNFMKESSDEENKKRKELLEKHAQEVSDLAEKLKKSHQRVQTLASKNKNYEAEAEAIDKMIFPSLGFEWTKSGSQKDTV
ncbi:hypothetical protein QYE76_003596 [Lolium multiflorum]|uniref:Uncharacterized protein n=1 Tax=Lolium multiflorum TaxID=4521 RepID=A0AAD8W1R1_LOLMU|nr:hypothetical protein QYE76_003596 [Lolium multiflorum]